MEYLVIHICCSMGLILPESRRCRCLDWFPLLGEVRTMRMLEYSNEIALVEEGESKLEVLNKALSEFKTSKCTYSSWVRYFTHEAGPIVASNSKPCSCIACVDIFCLVVRRTGSIFMSSHSLSDWLKQIGSPWHQLSPVTLLSS